MNIKRGQGFEYFNRRGYLQRALITKVTDDGVEYVRVIPAVSPDGSRVVKSYDDFGAVQAYHKDNVRLNSCPPPFSCFGSQEAAFGKMQSNAVAIADGDTWYAPMDVFVHFCNVLDHGATVAPEDLERVEHHPWPSCNKKELGRSGSDRGKMAQGRFAFVGESEREDEAEYG